ncbi:MAG: heme ABC exporter ATP-binding protein CcmA [Azospirillaceae bacterium]
MSDFTGTGLACLRGARLVFEELSFTLPPGGALVLTGPNGAGKSSLLRLMAGLIPPFAGALAWDGTPVDADPEAHRARVAYAGHAEAVKPVLSALDNLLFWAAQADPGQARARSDSALEAVGLGGLGDMPGRYLSAGQKRRLALARLLAAPAPVWLLDEPSVGLDTDGRRRLEAIIARHREGGGRVALATHAPIALPGAEALDLADFALPPDAAPDLFDPYTEWDAEPADDAAEATR